jgi:hypothetical protein
MRLGFVAMTLTLLLPQPADAWGDRGHRIICEIALQELTPAAKHEVSRLMALDTEFTSFSDACIWADHPRKRADEHFINLRRNSTTFTSAKCKVGPRCLLTAIEADVAKLRSSTISDSKKLEALKFLSHWVGDIHQPLHVAFQDDRGGNKIKAAAGPCADNVNLHSIWDSCIIKETIGKNTQTVAQTLESEITDVNRSEWNASGPRQWASESLFIAMLPGTQYCSQRDGVCRYSEEDEVFSGNDDDMRAVQITPAYLAQQSSIVRHRLKQAGVRLAGLLNQALQ